MPGEQVGNINEGFTAYIPKGKGIIMVNCQAAATLVSKKPRTSLPVNKYYLLFRQLPERWLKGHVFSAALRWGQAPVLFTHS